MGFAGPFNAPVKYTYIHSTGLLSHGCEIVSVNFGAAIAWNISNEQFLAETGKIKK